MPRPGGEADKLGNRYEGLWSVDTVLDLIMEEYTDLTLEPIGDEAAGVEFFVTRPSGTRAYHSVKRQQGDGNWTISRLTRQEGSSNRSILGDLLQKATAGFEAVFVSGTSATDLEALTARAKSSSSIADFHLRIASNGRLSGQFHDRIVPICSDEVMSYTALRQIEVTTKNERALRTDVERRIRSMFRGTHGGTIDPTAVRLLIAECLTDHLGTTLTSAFILAYLCEHDIVRSHLGGSALVGQNIEQLNRIYLQEVSRTLINRTRIDRQEAADTYATLLDGGKSVMLEGQAGGGKSSVLAQVIAQLQAQNVPCLVIRLDSLTEADHSSRAIGMRRELPESPAITLGQFAGDNPSVMCIDQLDALSSVSARQQSAWSAFNELLDEARSYPNMRILFACRSFDLANDHQLRALADDNSRVERIRVGELDSDTIESTITASGVTVGQLSPKQLEILSIPLHLYLFIEVAQSRGSFDFSVKADLFDAFWHHKSTNVGHRLSDQGGFWSRAIEALCNAMSERESLVAPDYAMDEHRHAITAMASESVLYVHDGYVRFFHEAFFDYAFARTFLRENTDLVQWLESDDQHLFRRSQVRQVLAFLRDREPNRGRYLDVLNRLLEHDSIRFHIKKLVIDWLRALPGPTTEEWATIEHLEDQLGWHRWSVISNSVPWFDVLHDMGRWRTWLLSDTQQVDLTVRLLRMPEVLDARSAAVAGLLSPFRGQSDQWRNRLRWVAQAGYGYTTSEMEEFVLGLVADGTLDHATREFAMNDDWWSIWYTAVSRWPAFIARVLGAWFDRQVQHAAELGYDDTFSRDLGLARHSQTSEHVIKTCAELAPRDFVREMLARFALLESKAPLQFISGMSTFGGPDDQLREALAQAMTFISQDDPSGLDAIMDAVPPADSLWMSALVLRAWSANPEAYGERVVRSVLDNPEQRLNIGYAIAPGGTDSFVAVSRRAVSAASSTCSDESFAELEEAILKFTTPQEQRNRQIGRTRLALLRSLSDQRLSKAARRQILELERRFPDAPKNAVPQLPIEDRTVQRVGPPIPPEAHHHMSDDQWLSALAKYTGEWGAPRDGAFVGGSVQLSQALKDIVREQPRRFAALASRMNETHLPIYFEAILDGLTNSQGSERHTGTADQVESVLLRVKDLGVHIRGTAISWAVGAIASESVSDDTLHMLCQIAVDSVDPEVDGWESRDGETGPIEQAINSSRGAAAYSLAQLLFADSSRWTRLGPTVARLAEDHVLSIRSVAVNCLLAVLDTHREEALALFTKLAINADRIVGSHYMKRFLLYAIFRDYSAVRPTLMTMLGSRDPTAVSTAAVYISIASLWLEEAHGDETLVLDLGEDARAGAAQTYAENLADETVGPRCEEFLRLLFADESETVRQAASQCWRFLTSDQVASYGSLIDSFIQSMGPEANVHILLYRLKDSRSSLPVELCDLAERLVGVYGSKASSMLTSEGGVAHELAPLMIRLHDETDNPTLRKRILDVIDKMVLAGFLGIDEHLGQQYDR